MTTLKKNPNAAIFAKLDNLTTSLISSSLPSTPWSDASFEPYLESSRDFQRGAFELATSSAKLAARFFEVYFGMTTIKPDNHYDLIAGVLGQAMIDNKSLMVSHANVKPPASVDVTVPVLLKSKYRFQGDLTSVLIDGRTITRDDMADVYQELMDMANDKDNNKNTELINLAAFTVLNLVRLIKGDAENFSRRMSTVAKTSYSSLLKPNRVGLYPLPHHDYLLLFKLHFDSTCQKSIHLFAWLVDSWIQHNKGTPNQDIVGILKAGCILNMSENGLGAISWSLKACDKLRLSIRVYLETILFNEVLYLSASKVAKFLVTHGKEVTWPFCRLFKDSALFEFSTRKNPDLAILSACIALQDYSLLSEMQQFESARSMLDTYWRYSEIIIDMFGCISSEVAYSESAQRVQLRFQEGGGRRGRGGFSSRGARRSDYVRHPDEDERQTGNDETGSIHESENEFQINTGE